MVLVVNNPPANAGDVRDLGSKFWVGKIPWRRAWQPTPVFLSGESHGQRSLEGYSTRGHKESETTEATLHALTLIGFCTSKRWRVIVPVFEFYVDGVTVYAFFCVWLLSLGIL